MSTVLVVLNSSLLVGLSAVAPTWLLLWLQANLCTGLVNMTINTLAVADNYAVGILMVYSLLFVFPVFCIQDILGIKLKIW